MSRFLRACFVVICCTLGALLPRGSAAADGPAVTVFAAASMTDVLERLAADYRQHSPDVIRFSFAASSALARQIESGAPADIFISANEEWADYLAGKNLVDPATRISPLGNTLVMIAPADSPLTNVALQPGFDIAGLYRQGQQARHRRSGQRTGRHLRQESARNFGRLGPGRSAYCSQRQRAGGSRSGRAWRGAARHRLRHRCAVEQQGQGSGRLPAGQLPAHPLSLRHRDRPADACRTEFLRLHHPGLGRSRLRELRLHLDRLDPVTARKVCHRHAVVAGRVGGAAAQPAHFGRRRGRGFCAGADVCLAAGARPFSRQGAVRRPRSPAAGAAAGGDGLPAADHPGNTRAARRLAARRVRHPPHLQLDRRRSGDRHRHLPVPGPGDAAGVGRN